MARIALAAREKGRGNASLFLFSSVSATVLCMLLAGCAESIPHVYPEDDPKYRIGTGFTGDLGVAPSMGHSVPAQGEVIKTPSCVNESREGRDCGVD